MTNKYRHHKYTWTKKFDWPTHRWEFVGPLGGMHFFATVAPGYAPSCGVEYHHTEACNFAPGEAPHHISCPMTGGRCWHVGETLYATETVWPILSLYLAVGDHDAIFTHLESEADMRFDPYATKILGAKS